MTPEGIQRTKCVNSGSEIHPHMQWKTNTLLYAEMVFLYISVFYFPCLILQRYLHKIGSCQFLTSIISSNCWFPHLKLQHPPCNIITLLYCHRPRIISSGAKKAEGTKVNPWMKNLYVDTFSWKLKSKHTGRMKEISAWVVQMQNII